MKLLLQLHHTYILKSKLEYLLSVQELWTLKRKMIAYCGSTQVHNLWNDQGYLKSEIIRLWSPRQVLVILNRLCIHLTTKKKPLIGLSESKTKKIFQFSRLTNLEFNNLNSPTKFYQIYCVKDEIWAWSDGSADKNRKSAGWGVWFRNESTLNSYGPNYLTKEVF